MNCIQQQIENLFLPLPSDLRKLAEELRKFIKHQTSPSVELIFSSYNSINIGYGFSEKAWDCYCGIIIYNKHINLSFPSGARLPDPEKILQGTGTRVRHIKIRSLEDVKQPSVVMLLNNARENAWQQTNDENLQQKTLRTLIRPRSNKIE